MLQQMLGQQSDSIKLRAALLALVLLVCFVNYSVSPQNVAAEETLVANGALVWPFVSMTPLMNLQVVSRAGMTPSYLRNHYQHIRQNLYRLTCIASHTRRSKTLCTAGGRT